MSTKFMTAPIRTSSLRALTQTSRLRLQLQLQPSLSSAYSLALPSSKRLYKKKASTMSAQTPHIKAANRLKNVFEKGEAPAMGAWQMLPGANISRLLTRTGVDWIMVDMEHGNIDDSAMHDAVPAIAATGVSPIVRTPDLQTWMIKRALDSGAHGVLVPLLRTVDEAKQVARATKFPPLGQRGFGNPWTFERFDRNATSMQYLQQANDSVLTMVQIETKEAFEAVDEIAAVDGIDVLFIGPFDLGNNLGCPMITADGSAELKAAISKIQVATQKAGKKCGILAVSGEQAKQYADQGFDMISVYIDYSGLEAFGKNQISVAKGLAK